MADDNTAALIRARVASDPEYLARLFHIESGGNPMAVTGSNRGLAQMGPEEERRYGINDANRANPEAQAAATLRERAEHSAVLRKALGRDSTPGEQYLTHQQGIAGGPALLSADPTMPAWQAIRPYYKNDAIARLAITGNVPSNHPLYGQPADKITAGDFRDLWVNKFERGLSGARPGAAPQATPPVAGGPISAAPVPAAGPSQNGQVPVAAENAAGGEDELLQTLQRLSAPRQAAAVEEPPQINFPTLPGLQRARALALAMGKTRIA